jgi:phage-related protein
VKKIAFVGSSLKNLKEFPESARSDAGYALSEVQKGKEPSDWKPMSSIGSGVKEIRVKDEQGIFRVVYIVKYLDRVNVLHAFQKKTQKTAKKDIELAKQRLKLVLEEVKNDK